MAALEFAITIRAPLNRVWDTMLAPASYVQWARAFSPNSTYQGSWTEGETMTFLDPDLGGTRAVLDIVEAHERIEARHVAIIDASGAADDATEFAEKWIGTLERYRFEETAGETTLSIDIETHDDFVEMFSRAWPVALHRLRNLCEPIHRGVCACGEVRFELDGPPLFVHCCHCRWCQRETGSAFVLNALIESDRFRVMAGEPEETLTPSESGKGQRIFRCPSCRVALWSHYAGLGDLLTFVRVGTLIEPDRLPPDIHIFTSSKQPWVELPKTTPSFAEFYEMKELWPAESLERRKALLALHFDRRENAPG
jgi:hypothetical protein